jgi:hypothetical protein
VGRLRGVCDGWMGGRWDGGGVCDGWMEGVIGE